MLLNIAKICKDKTNIWRNFLHGYSINKKSMGHTQPVVFIGYMACQILLGYVMLKSALFTNNYKVLSK